MCSVYLDSIKLLYILIVDLVLPKVMNLFEQSSSLLFHSFFGCLFVIALLDCYVLLDCGINRCLNC